ncbi:MAG: MFS transporter [Verrucomicrobiae bacterium]|nr:MFS transporter [Verrucomicrobiae bacterium]
MSSEGAARTHDPYAALRHANFRRFFLGGTVANMGQAMQNIAVGWDLYERTGFALALGGVGLVQVIPIVLLALPAGHLADRLDRRRLLLASQGVQILMSLGLAALAATHGPVPLIYLCLFISAVARAFNAPANNSFWPSLLPIEHYANAITWRSSAFELASVVGPAIGGMLIGFRNSAVPAYLGCAALVLVFWINLCRIRAPSASRPHEPMNFDAVSAGLRFVWNHPVLLPAIALDMFAVLLGGATALLPIYAKDILHMGPSGLGWLRAAPAAGAVTMALVSAHRPVRHKAGATMLWAVAGFGVATIVFGGSRSFWLSMAALYLTGVFDNMSVVIRHSLLQLRTPDRMRGRVTSVNTVFISCSNELGAFESGAVAALFTPVVSVVAGGIGTILVVVAAAFKWPALRRLDALLESSRAPAKTEIQEEGSRPSVRTNA